MLHFTGYFADLCFAVKSTAEIRVTQERAISFSGHGNFRPAPARTGAFPLAVATVPHGWFVVSCKLLTTLSIVTQQAAESMPEVFAEKGGPPRQAVGRGYQHRAARNPAQMASQIGRHPMGCLHQLRTR